MKRRNSTYPRTLAAPDEEPVLKNVPRGVETGKQAWIRKLKEKIKVNIDNCRKTMVKTKQTLSFRDSRGNLPTGQGGGKFGQKRPKATVGEENPAAAENKGNASEQTISEEQQSPAVRTEAPEPIEVGEVAQGELEVSTEDELPREDKSQGEVRTGALVANAFRQLSEVAECYDRYDVKDRARLVEEGEMEEDQIDEQVDPPTRSASKERPPGKKEQTPSKKKANSPAERKEGISNKDRQAQLVQGFQRMVHTMVAPPTVETNTTGVTVEGMVEVRAEGEGDVPWCGANTPQGDPVKGATRLKGGGSGAAIRTSKTHTKSPRGQKRKEAGEEGNSAPKKSKGAPEENSREETPMMAQKNRKGKSPKKRPATGTTEVLVEAPLRKEPKAAKSVRGSSQLRGENQLPSERSTQSSGTAVRVPDEIQEEEDLGMHSGTRKATGRKDVPGNVPPSEPRSTRSSGKEIPTPPPPSVKQGTGTVTKKGHRMVHTE